MSSKSKAYKVITIATVVVTLIAALYIMLNHLGLNPDLDFGAGAYYYADIPDYDKTLNWDVFQPALPYIVYVLLFLVWGFAMWKLWKWVDNRPK